MQIWMLKKRFISMKTIVVKTDFCGENWAASAELECGIVVATATSLEELKLEMNKSILLHIASCVEDGDEMEEELRRGEYELVFEYCRPNELVVVIERSKDSYGAYAENVSGICGAGATIDECKRSVMEVIEIYRESDMVASAPGAVLDENCSMVWRYEKEEV